MFAFTALRMQFGGGLPPTTALPASLQTLACRRWPISYLSWCHKRLGDRFVVYPVDMPPLVFLAEPSEIRAVLTAPANILHPGRGAAITAPLFGADSFMLQEEDAHMKVRNAITPLFHRKGVEGHAAEVAEIVRREVASWPVGEVFASHLRLRALTLRVILKFVFGCESDVVRELHGRLLEMFSVTASLVLQEPRARRIPGWRGTWRSFLRRREEADGLIFDLIRQRMREAPDADSDLLDALLAGRRADGALMSMPELRDNLVSTIVAGHETTAASLAWAFQMLAHNRDAQERLAAEIREDEGEEYLTATIHEVLRHSPVFLFASPRAVVDSFELGDWTYRSPVHLCASTYLMHHSPDLYPDPDAFRPERFIGAAPQPRIWLPWGGGRKVCVGRHLAVAEMRAVLRQVVGDYVLQPASQEVERAHWRSVMLAPHAGSRVVLKPRSPRRARLASLPARVSV